MDSIDRFWNKVEKIPFHECWEWTGSKINGYGQFSVKAAHIKAHRFSWLLHYGDIPDNLLVLHKCDNPSCVRPDHLFLGTILDNTKDKLSKNRQSRCNGEKNYHAKLKEQDIKNIRDLKNNKTVEELAILYNISISQMRRIINKIRWKHI